MTSFMQYASELNKIKQIKKMEWDAFNDDKTGPATTLNAQVCECDNAYKRIEWDHYTGMMALRVL